MITNGTIIFSAVVLTICICLQLPGFMKCPVSIAIRPLPHHALPHLQDPARLRAGRAGVVAPGGHPSTWAGKRGAIQADETFWTPPMPDAAKPPWQSCRGAGKVAL